MALPGVEEVRSSLQAAQHEWPIQRILRGEEDLYEAGARALTDAMNLSAPNKLPAGELWVSPTQGYHIGMATLGLRAYALAQAGPIKFRHAYRLACADRGFNALDATARRRAMYFPVLADDDGLVETVAEIISWQAGPGNRPLFKLVQTMERIKGMAMRPSHFDWQPFGGPP